MWDSSRELQGLKADNLDLYMPFDTEGDYDIPIIHPELHIPEHGLIGFNYARTSINFKKGVHCFLHDYQFNGIWTDPRKYLGRMAKFDCFFTPDFSLYTNMSHAQRIWNTYRSRLIGHFFQSRDILVIPSVTWNGPDTYYYCFDGLPEEGTVAVSTQGCYTDSMLMKIYRDGIKELVARKQPQIFLVYGKGVDADYGDAQVVNFENDYIKELRKHQKKAGIEEYQIEELPAEWEEFDD